MSRSARVPRHPSMNEIVITGATGVIGQRVVRQLVAAGHSVTGVTRSKRSRAIVQALGARAVDADVYDGNALTAAFAGADTVVNLLTRIPAADAMAKPGAWDDNDRLRREASAVIAQAAQAAGVTRLIQESVAFVYADGGDEWLDEDAPVQIAGPTQTAFVAEANAIERFAGATVVLRFGLFVGPDSHLTQSDVEAARAGISPTLGARSAYRPTVWLDDAAAAVTSALRAPAGVYNVADSDPPTRAQIDAALGAAVGRRALRPAFEEVPPALELMTRSQRVSSARLREATGWAPSVRGGTDGWALVLEERPAA
jgi:UDP-glucose 4-epimerase